MAERKAEYTTGKYTDGFGPGNAGLWFVKRAVEEHVAYGKTESEALEIAEAFRAAEKTRHG